MEFNEIKDLINSEGAILTLVESVDLNDMTNERLYLRAICLKGRAYIYCKVNPFVLELFFQGRIAVKELYLIKIDEEYIIEFNGNQYSVVCDEPLIEKVINGIECANSYYYNLPQNMRIISPFDEILHIVNRDYINGLGSVLANRIYGKRWLIDNGL